MRQPRTLFQLRADPGGAFDGSSQGIAVMKLENASALPDGSGVHVDGGLIQLARHPDLDGLESFTVEATVTPEVIGGQARTILAGQSPPISLAIRPTGAVVATVRTAEGVEELHSEDEVVRANAPARILFTRAANGETVLAVDGQPVATRALPAKLAGGDGDGIAIGGGTGDSAFVGRIEDLAIHDGLVDEAFVSSKRLAATEIREQLRLKTGLDRISVDLFDDSSRARLQAIRDILDAAGVSRLSDLTTLSLTSQTVMVPGRVLVAGRTGERPRLEWSKLAQNLVSPGEPEAKRGLLAEFLTNRNSAAVLSSLGAVETTPAPGAGPASTLGAVRSLLSSSVTAVRRTPGAISSGGRLSAAGAAGTGVRVPAEVRAASPTLRRAISVIPVTDLLRREGEVLRPRAEGIVELLEAGNPALWPTPQAPDRRLLALTTIPIDTAVIIANTLDLTEAELLVEPTVTKLYVIAEQVVCGPGARINWRRPGGSTPPRGDDPDLAGRGWAGVQTKPDSRDGLDGQSAQPGGPGLDGARGAHAPSLEMWVKAMTAMPTVELPGEDGRPGGHGQRGGRGGDGADGHVGRRVWVFGWHCTDDPGDGGNGGDGGRGGDGGHGGNGGNGGDITVGVLGGTLASTITQQAFRLQNQGGRAGSGGEGGEGGPGGAGGRSGAGETCTDARNGHAGAPAQPGANGPAGFDGGIDGEVRLFEFSEDAWDELLTRPWISQIVPTDVFPGDQLTIRGSRFTSADRVLIDSASLVPAINADESISVGMPLTLGGGEHSVALRRPDGTESNRLTVGVKPQLDPVTDALAPAAEVTLTGRAFSAGASVLLDGTVLPATSVSPTRIQFVMTGTGGLGSSGGSVLLQVRNPDGRVSNGRTAARPRILEIPFTYGVHDLGFGNFDDGVPSWGTYADTFGAAEVWHELLDPIFGHPVLTAAFYLFYEYFLKGKGNGGLATGFCTSLAAVVADRLWTGKTDTHSLTSRDPMHAMLTAVHGKLLSRQSLLHFHDQGRQGLARVEQTAREIEATFLRACDRQNAPLLFFIPSGDVWDSGYIDRLSDSHCVMPYRFIYPVGHPGPQLSPDGSTTTSLLDGVQLRVWDCNNPASPDCYLVFHQTADGLTFEYLPDQAAPEFASADGITLGMMTNGAYHLADHDLPFSGPFGLTRFVVDFLLSPATLQVTDALGLRAGDFSGQILSEIPNSHPAYLAPGMFLLPTETALTRRMVGAGNGTYSFHSVMPGLGSLTIGAAPISAGEEDVLSVNADGTQVRFAPAAEKPFDLTIARTVGSEVRAFSVSGIAAGPGQEVDVTISPELSLLRLGNRGAGRNVSVRAFGIDAGAATPRHSQADNVTLPASSDLVMAVPDWSVVDLNVQTVPFA